MHSTHRKASHSVSQKEKKTANVIAFVRLRRHYYYYGYGLWLLPNIRVAIWLASKHAHRPISHSIESNN